MARKRRGRGEGSIYQRGDGRWCASQSAGYFASGRRRRKIVYGTTKAEVQQKLRDLETSGIAEEPDRLTVAEYLPRWLKSAAIAPSTRHRYEQLYRLHVVPYIGHIRVSKLAPM